MIRFFTLLAFFIALPLSASAASLYLSPTSLTLAPGQSGTFSVFVESTSQAMNAVSGSIVAPGMTLGGVSKSGSIISFWATEPAVVSGTLSFEGVVLTPGYTGAAGRILSFTVKASTAGTYTASYSNGSVLANDGRGTDITSGTRGGTITVSAAAPVPKVEVEADEPDVPVAPPFSITSETHPDQTAWYSKTTGVFSWDVPPSASATRLVLSNSKSATPTIEYDTALAQKTIDGLTDGISYLRVQHKVDGVWGGIATYKIQIDTTAPKPFEITFPLGSKGISPQPTILFKTTDALSGIERYDVRIGEGAILTTPAPTNTNPYMLPIQEPGPHVVSVTAYDNAGNPETETATFFVEGIDTPKITYYEEDVAYDSLLKVRGITYANTTIEVYVYNGTELLITEPTLSNSQGDFATIVTKRLEPGTYTLRARAIDARGARSLMSDPLTFKIHGGFLTDIGFFIRDNLAVSIALIIILLGFFFIHLYGWRHLIGLVYAMRREHEEANAIVHRAFAILKKDIATHMRSMRVAGSKRMLSEEEVAFLEEFEGELDEAEAVVQKQVKRARED